MVIHLITPRAAKRQKLSEDVQHTINSYLLKPRHFYELIHGKKPRWEAYEMCLFLIDYAAQGIPFFDVEEMIVKMQRVGVEFGDKNIIYRKDNLLWSLMEFNRYQDDWKQSSSVTLNIRETIERCDFMEFPPCNEREKYASILFSSQMWSWVVVCILPSFYSFTPSTIGS